MTHQRKTKRTLRVKLIRAAVYRLGETKRICVVYEDAAGVWHVRAKAEFEAMFEEVKA